MVSKVFGLIFIVFSFLSAWIWMDYKNVLNEPVIKAKPINFEINKGDTFNRITDKLIDHGIAINPVWFKIIAYQRKLTDKLKAGEYELPIGLTTPEILTLFVKGKSRQYAITFPEGWTFKQMLLEINNNKQIIHTFQDLDDSTIMKKIGAEQAHPEGLFFPDTYYFEKNMTDLSLLKRAYDKMQQILHQEWSTREQGLPLESPYQVLILASIVEKETAKVEERATIAGVFIRRLQQGMLLQTDPTVIYGMGDEFQGDIRSKDLLTETAYNTYIIAGLPPTPIAMPGKEAIHAVLHPEKGDSMYFVARGDGSHVFSATLNNHNKAVDIFQRKKHD
jgi:peptidoglycan lytic transglycosylase G